MCDRSWLGSALTAQKKYKQAIKELEGAIRGSHEKLSHAYNNLGVSLQVIRLVTLAVGVSAGNVPVC